MRSSVARPPNNTSRWTPLKGELGKPDQPSRGMRGGHDLENPIRSVEVRCKCGFIEALSRIPLFNRTTAALAAATFRIVASHTS
jgi:hypothetical protein